MQLCYSKSEFSKLARELNRFSARASRLIISRLLNDQFFQGAFNLSTRPLDLLSTGTLDKQVQASLTWWRLPAHLKELSLHSDFATGHLTHGEKEVAGLHFGPHHLRVVVDVDFVGEYTRLFVLFLDEHITDLHHRTDSLFVTNHFGHVLLQHIEHGFLTQANRLFFREALLYRVFRGLR